MGWDPEMVFKVIFRPLGFGGNVGVISLLPSPTAPGPNRPLLNPGVLWPSPALSLDQGSQVQIRLSLSRDEPTPTSPLG